MVNSVSFRNSSRRRPLKLSMKAFCCGPHPELVEGAGLDVVPVEMKTLRPAEHRQAGELGAVVGDALPGQSPPGDQGLQLADHTAARQRGVGHQAQVLAGIVVDHRQDPEPSAVAQRVVHEVHRPTLVRLPGRYQRNPRHHGPLASDAAANLQPLLDIEPTQLLVVEPHALAPVAASSQSDGAPPPTRASARGRPCRPVDGSDSEPGSGPPRSRGTPAAGSPHVPCGGVPPPPAELWASPFF